MILALFVFTMDGFIPRRWGNGPAPGQQSVSAGKLLDRVMVNVTVPALSLTGLGLAESELLVAISVVPAEIPDQWRRFGSGAL